MSGIQILLLFSVVPCGYLYIYWLQKSPILRLVVATLVAMIAIVVLFPEVSTAAAYRVGVGRGADLVIYLALVAVALLIGLIFRRCVLFEQKMTLLVRDVALSRARRWTDANHQSATNQV